MTSAPEQISPPDSPQQPTIVEGIDVDAAAAAVRSCPGVADLDAGRTGVVSSYLPGRKVAGLSIHSDRIAVSVRARWGTTAADLLTQITAALAEPGLGRPIDITIADIDLPSPAPETRGATT